MTEDDLSFRVEKGTQIRLNCLALAWTRGLVFTVDEVRHWGVRCYTTEDVPAPVHKTEGGKAWYPAVWRDIDIEVKP